MTCPRKYGFLNALRGFPAAWWLYLQEMEFSIATGEEPFSTLVSECDAVTEGKNSCISPSNLQPEQKTNWEENAELLKESPYFCKCVPANSSVPTSPNVKEGIALQQQQKDISLKITMVKCKTGLPDSELQEYLRRQLRLLENDDRKARAVFCELSARLLSIHSEDYLIVVTFWTFEEIWKFVTYCSLEEAVGIDVHLDEKCLDTIYRGLLIQEGTFFVFHPENVVSERRAADAGVRIYQLNCAAVTERAPEATGGSLAKGFSEPLIPFHQWFLKENTEPIDFVLKTEPTVTAQTATGFSVAIISHESAVPEEIRFQKGDRIEIIGYFMKCMQWFVGRHIPTGQVGFVQSSHVKLDDFKITTAEPPYLAFFEDEHYFFAKEKAHLEENVINLLTQASHYNICNVYQLDGQEDLELEKSTEQGKRAQIEMSHSFLNENGSTMQYNVVQSLMKVKDLQLYREETDDQKRQFSASNKEMPSKSQEPCFRICPDDDVCAPEIFESLLLFLNYKGYESSFKDIYDLSFSFLSTLFYGYASEEDLVDYFVLAREAAKRAGLLRALARLCYLLGRMSVRKFKLSQARVYFEEALATIHRDFSDLFLITTLYTNLTGIYLKQNNKEKCDRFFEKVASLLMGLPAYISSTVMESDILKYALKRAVLSQSEHAEARACFLLAKHYLNFQQGEEALPFLERLQLLSNNLGLQNDSLSVDCYFKLGQLYSEKCLPHLVLSCVKAASSCISCTFLESFRSIDLVFKNAPKLHSLKVVGQRHPSQIAYYLRQILHLLESSKEHQKLCSMVYCYLSLLYSHHKQYRKAIDYMEKVLDTNVHASIEEIINHLVFLSWLYILYQQNTVALDILNAIVESTQSSCQQLGIVYNMTAIVLKRMNNTKQAAANYYKALSISRDMGVVHNQAVALANLGILCLRSAARHLGEHFLIKAVTLFSHLPSVECGRDFLDVLLKLGCYYANGTYKDKGRCCYEWAFLVAMETDNLEGQLQAVQHLCQFYSTVLPDEAQCVIYNEYQLSLVRKTSDKVMEGQILETISQLYLSLGTERAYRSALEYTKRSLGIFIDLQAKEREAQAWLQAGKIYYMLRQNELVDLYIQVAQNAALCTHDPNLEMELFEASGDVFFNGDWEKEKAVPFYRDKALPLAMKMQNSNAELRLFNKLVGLLLTLKAYEECLGYAQAALILSVNLGNQLSERIAYHRLAVIHHHLEQCELTEHFFLKALSLCPSPLEFDEEALYYVKVYLVLGDITFYDLKDPFDAAGYYTLALAAAMDLGNKKAQLKIYTRLAIIYHNFLVDRERSLYFYQKARAFATELNIRRINLAPDQHMRTSWASVKNVM
ncbi:SH3 domain and tetratricopeptide repeat-containing protein 1 isoform X2 [Rhineura floridana]|uniref:SH3 domain and tetratricopeptide repeat-containing protein 1 isoform X2 n=1 Tax=Rhineura floridana TaxID=261503 RepID=UPI002AC829FE|nr:SH3 domain and tetratricopeptide repeat-containing protein 1 isoform X2 [Rhineura floridana]